MVVSAYAIPIMEDFFELLKSELLYLREFSSMAEFRIELEKKLYFIITSELRANRVEK